MRNGSHTLIGTLRHHVEAWRKRNGWSRETCVAMIVEAHEAAGFNVDTGIEFVSQNKDAFSRMHTNAERVFRWLDDVTKDTNHLPSNFIPSILIAMPIDVRIAALADLLTPQGVSVSRMDCNESADLPGLLQAVINESAQAQSAVVSLLDGATTAELAIAQRELSESIDASRQLLANVEQQLNERMGA